MQIGICPKCEKKISEGFDKPSKDVVKGKPPVGLNPRKPMPSVMASKNIKKD